MSILGNILARITGNSQPRSTPKPPPAAPRPAASAAPPQSPPPMANGKPAAATPAAAPTKPLESVDVEEHLDALAAKNAQKLDWRHSIVDMMKLLGMESSLSERKELAKELGYTGDMGDSAKMNLWLHQEVLQAIARNGGKVPQEMLH